VAVSSESNSTNTEPWFTRTQTASDGEKSMREGERKSKSKRQRDCRGLEVSQGIVAEDAWWRGIGVGWGADLERLVAVAARADAQHRAVRVEDLTHVIERDIGRERFLDGRHGLASVSQRVCICVRERGLVVRRRSSEQ